MIIYIILIIVCIAIVIAGFCGASKAFDEDWIPVSAVLTVLTIAFTILTIAIIINSFMYASISVNVESWNKTHIEERAMCVKMLDEVSPASETYLEICDKITTFNLKVRNYEKWGGTFMEGLFCDPSYKNLETIPIN